MGRGVGASIPHAAKNPYITFDFLTNLTAVAPRYPPGTGSRTPLRYQNLQMLKIPYIKMV